MALSGSCQTSTWTGETYHGKLVFTWSATQNASNNSSTISWEISASVWKNGGGNSGWITFSQLSVVIDGTTVYSRGADEHTQCSDGQVLARGTKTLTHNVDGTRSFSVSIGAGIYNYTINERGSGSFTLNQIPVYTLSVTAGTGSSVSVNRTSSGYASTGVITNGARLYRGDTLKITFTASSGYAISTHTVNGSAFTSGSSHTVSGNVAVAAAALAAYTLTISAGTGSTIAVNRTSSQCAATGSLSNNAKIYSGDKLKITFAAGANYAIDTHTVNGAAFTSGNTHTVSGNTTVAATARVLASGVKATNANIGEQSTITVTKYNNNYYHSLQYAFGGLSGYITSSGGVSGSEVKFSNATVNFTVPTSFYAKIPNAKSGTCTITCRTYSSASSTTILGSAVTCTFTATAKESTCKPALTGTVTDVNSITAALTGNSGKLVRYMSAAECVLNATAKNSATISSRRINNTDVTLDGGSYKKTINSVSSNAFTFETTDSRGYKTTASVTPTMVNYVKLTCNPVVSRVTPTGNDIKITITGDYFSGSFGAVTNTLTLQFRYRKSTATSWGGWNVISGNNIQYGTRQSGGITIPTYTVSITHTLGDASSYQYAYDIDVYARDGKCTVGGETKYLTAITRIQRLPMGVPVFDWGENDFNINVPLNVNGDITSRGKHVCPQYMDIELENVPITILSTKGAYYYVGDLFSSYGINGVVISLVVTLWGNAEGAFFPYAQNDRICFMSDVSQTVQRITLRVVYLE